MHDAVPSPGSWNCCDRQGADGPLKHGVRSVLQLKRHGSLRLESSAPFESHGVGCLVLLAKKDRHPTSAAFVDASIERSLGHCDGREQHGQNNEESSTALQRGCLWNIHLQRIKTKKKRVTQPRATIPPCIRPIPSFALAFHGLYLHPMAHIDLDAPIYVAGHRGMVGSALVRELQQRGHTNLILRTSAELDLREQAAVFAFWKRPGLCTCTSSQPRWAASMRTMPTRQTSCSTTSRCKPT